MRDLLIYFIMILAVAGIFMSLILLLKNQPPERQRISVINFVVLLLVYATVMGAFGIIYICLELLGFPVLIEGERLHYKTFFHLVEDVLYFSAVTMLTVGYGDITPQGIGRWVAMIQALIGYILPAAFVVTTVIYQKKPSRL